jgi:hypothetical protein
MALGSELFNLSTSFDPYGAYREGGMKAQKYDIEQQKLDVRQQAMKEAQSELAPTEQTSSPLASMAKSMLPPGFQLQGSDGIPTSSGLLNQQIINSQQDLTASQQMMKQATMARAEGDDKAYANLVSEARRLQTTATTNMANAKKEYQKSIDDGIESLYGANSQTDYDQRLKDALTRTGLPLPKGFPETWTPELKPKLLSMMSPETRNKVEKEERARRDELRKEKTADLQQQRLEALLRNGQGSGKETPAQTRIVQALTQTSDALKNVANLPITTTGPMFQQKQFNSLYTAPLSALNQQLSDETSQMLQTRMTGVSRGLAALESGGAATGLVGLTESIEKGTFIPAGAKLNVALDKLGEMRRIVESSAKAMLNDPKLSPERKQLIQDELGIVQKAIPFTQADIDRARKESKTNPDLTFTEFTAQKFSGEKTAKTGNAPQSALDYLKANPTQKEAFKAKYGYLPEGY